MPAGIIGKNPYVRYLLPVAPKRKRGRPPKKKRKLNTSESEKSSGSKAR